MSITKVFLILALSSCGEVSDKPHAGEVDAVSMGLLIEGAGLAWDLVGDRSELPQPVKFSMFPTDVALSEGKWFKQCEPIIERTLLGFKAFEAELCVSGYTNVQVINDAEEVEAKKLGYYLRDIRVKLEVKKLDPLWDIFGQGSFGDAYMAKFDPHQVPAVDIYADFNIYSLIGLHSSYNRHYRVDGLGQIKAVSY